MLFSERKAALAALSSRQRETLRRATLRGQGADEAARAADCSRRQAAAMREQLLEVGVLSKEPSRVPAQPHMADPRQLGLFR
jgi:hypothetical protein